MSGRANIELLERRLLSQVARASHQFRLIEPDDRIMVAVSGGKDSMAMLHLLREIRKRAPFEFSLVAVNLDQGHPGFPERVLPDYFEREGYDYRILKEDTYSVVKEKVPAGKTYCSLCSRLRRGILYSAARELSASKIALGHHRDDAIETLLLNLFYSGQIKSMPPRLHADDGQNVVIRPLALCAERDIAQFAAKMQFPIVPCDLCGSQDNLKRQQVKRLIADLERDNPQVRANLVAALGNVRPSHLFDQKLWNDRGADDEQPAESSEGSGAPIVPIEKLLRQFAE
jgi:tRNA 2-thiocytidine biosynthesis protein TtcA